MKEIAYFGAGCFWGVEHIFSQVEGVIDVESGYMGGDLEDPTYKDVCTGLTGHAEVVKVLYDSQVASYDELLDYFWRLHDPTQLNRQGIDFGSQYRSAIFYINEEQRVQAQESQKNFDQSGVFDVPSVTEVSPASTFYPAEEYHQDYYLKKYSSTQGHGPICHVLRKK